MRKFVSREEHESLHRAYKKLVEEHNELLRVTQQLDHEHGILRVVFTRVIIAIRAITLEVPEEVPEGIVKWAEVQTESGSMQMTVWYEAPGEPVASSNGDQPVAVASSEEA